MDLVMAARFFDLEEFENYDFVTETWGTEFLGQQKRADQFLSIYHRPTRKRMLYVDGVDNKPTSSVIRVKSTQEIFMVGSIQPDIIDNEHYRSVYSLTKPNGPAMVYRKSPVGPSNDPGWAIADLVEKTFADVELRTMTEQEDSSLLHHGHVIVTLPTDSAVEPLDTIYIGGLLGQEYYILERYVDSNLVNARAVARQDEFSDMVYKHYTGQSYANQQVVKNFTSYNVTGRARQVAKEELQDGITSDSYKVFFKASWFPTIVPTLNDEIVIGGTPYQVKKYLKDPLTTEWHFYLNF